MNNDLHIRGYRIREVRKPDRELSYTYLQLSHEGAQAQTNLRESVAKNGANCVGKEEQFSGDTLPSARDASLMCASCPSFNACEVFLKLGRPAYGVFSGQVIGRGLMEDIEEEF